MNKIIKNHHYYIGDDFFMRKLTIIIIALILIISLNKIKASSTIIPDEAIRLRVIANSNSEYDQNIKMKVSENLQSNVYQLIKDTKGIESARKKIKSNINNIDTEIKKTLIKENYPLDYKIEYGQNYFPEKIYKGIKYDKGYYESLVVTLQEGKGDNWWCVLFPPLCLMEAEESEEVEYKFFIQELIEKYL